MFLGSPVLDLPALLQYRSAGGADDTSTLAKLDKLDALSAGKEVKSLVSNMLQRDPTQRKDASDLLHRCETVVGESGSPLFPPSFSGFLFKFMVVLQRAVHTPDERIMFVCRHYGRIMRHCCGVHDEEGAGFFVHFAPADSSVPGGDLGLDADDPAPPPPAPPNTAPAGAGRDGDDLDALAEETRALLASLDQSAPPAPGPAPLPAPVPPTGVLESEGPGQARGGGGPGAEAPESALIVVAQLVCACIRHVREPQSKLLGLQLLARFSPHLDDDARLQRLVPHVIALLDGPDQNALVRAAAVRAVRDILAQVQRFSASDADIFPKYVFPALQKLPSDPEELVRIAFAESIAGLAESSRRFLEISNGLLAQQQLAGEDGGAAAGGPEAATAVGAVTGSGTGSGVGFEEKLEQLQNTVSKWFHDLIGDMEQGQRGGGHTAGRSNLVKRALLRDITRLCIFFGAAGTANKILPLLITLMNDRDWELRYAFCAHIPALGAFLGPVKTEEFVVPVSHPLIVDVEELVVSRALRCLATLTELGLLLRDTMLERAAYCAPLLLHPGSWVRHGAALLVTAIARRLGTLDAHAFLFPKLAPFLAVDLAACAAGPDGCVSKEAVGHASHSPVSRWAFKKELLRLVDIVKNRSPEQPPSQAKLLEAIGGADAAAAEQAKLALMGTYLRNAALNLMQKMDPAPVSQPPQPPAPAGPSPAVVRAAGRRGSATEAGQARRGSAALAGGGGGEMSRLQLHADKLSSTPSSFLYVPKSVTAHGAVLLDSKGVRLGSAAVAGERDALLAARRGFLEHYFAHQGARPMTLWSLPPALQDAARVQALFGVTFNSKDAMRLARNAAEIAEAAENDGGYDRHRTTSNMGEGGAPGGAASVAGGGGGGGNDDGGARGRRRGNMFLASIGEGLDAATLQRRILALGIPPLPPDFGAPRRWIPGAESMGGGGGGMGGGVAPAAGSGAAGAVGAGGGSARTKEWRPKVGVVVQTLTEHMPKDDGAVSRDRYSSAATQAREHSGAVNRLAVSPDNSFFVSASSDGTSRVWATAHLDSNVALHASAVYAQQQGRILDACMVENTRSVCTASDAGDVHVWRVDLVGPASAYGAGRGGGAMGTSEVRRVPLVAEGPVLCLAHFNTDSGSMLLYGTQKGYIHCWDLRSEEEPWRLRVPPELGFLTALSLGSGVDKHWVCAGTSRGYVAIWDLRFQLLVRLWRHSSRGPVQRLATCARLPEDPESAPSQPLAFVAAGDSELAVWNLSTGGACRRCFRSVTPQVGVHAAPLPTLDAVPLPAHPDMPVLACSHPTGPRGTGGSEDVHSVRSIMGRISTGGNSYVITGSTDRHIRFWDMATPSKCFTVSGLEPGQVRCWEQLRERHAAGAPGVLQVLLNFDLLSPDDPSPPPPPQPRPTYDSIPLPLQPDSTLFVCFDTDVPSRDNVVPSHLPVREQRGLVAPSVAHNDAVLDLKGIDLPSKMMLSCRSARPRLAHRTHPPPLSIYIPIYIFHYYAYARRPVRAPACVLSLTAARQFLFVVSAQSRRGGQVLEMKRLPLHKKCEAEQKGK